jgi:nitroreductase
MDFETVLRSRRSVRSFTDFTPPERDIEKILEAAEMAPSAGGLEARKILVIRSKNKREALAKASSDQAFIEKAPYILLFCADLKRIEPYGKRGKELYCIQDTSASAENALLMAVNLGLGACWVGSFDEVRVSEICGLPDYLRPVVIVPVGYEK